MLNFIDGWVPPDLDHFSDETLAVAAGLLHRLHDATAGCDLAAGHEVVCHNDPSPCNYVFVAGQPAAFIDFDHAAPGERLRDVAYADGGCERSPLTMGRPSATRHVGCA